YATACAWLPEEWVRTPAARRFAGRRLIAWYAPRSLNEPTGCRHSGFSHRSPAHVAGSSGVRTATPEIALAATCTWSRLTKSMIESYTPLTRVQGRVAASAAAEPVRTIRCQRRRVPSSAVTTDCTTTRYMSCR